VRGLVAVRVFEDIPAAYPRSLQIVEVFHIAGGKLDALRRISSELPFGMKPHE
jgi:hypothetical protein